MIRSTMQRVPLSVNQVLDRFEFLEAIPRTSTGKFWKMKLRAQYR